MENPFSTATFVKWTILAVTFLSVFAWDSVAQQQPTVPTPEALCGAQSATSEMPPPKASSPTIAPSDQTHATPDKDKVKNDKPTTTTQRQAPGTSNDRLFFAFPNFLTLENASEVPPLTTAEKFKVVTRDSFDYAKYFWYGALAGIGQAENSQGGYGQGAAGYGKRYGAAFADGTIEDYITSAILPSLLHQDPRYFQLGKGGFWHRTGYAMSRMVITRSDSGHNKFNYSEIIGSGVGASISTFSYYPRADRTASNVMSVWGTQLGIDTFVIVLKEFWPDIRRKLHKCT